MFELIILLISIFANLLLGAAVYIKNPKSITNKLFLILTSSFIAWSSANYFSDHPVGLSQLWWIRLVLFTAAFLCLSIYLTFNVFPHFELTVSNRFTKLAIIATIIVMPLTLTPLVFKGLKITHGSVQPIPNFGIPLFAIVVVGLLGGGIFTLLNKFRHSKGRQKIQIKFVLYGLGLTMSLIVITDFLFVVLLKNSKLVPLGPAYTLIFSGTLAYAIVKHKLFDIKSAVARALAYIFSLSTIGLIYGGIFFLVSNVLTSDINSKTIQRVIYIAFALVTAAIYQRVKLFFDRITSKIFYKDSYDAQAFIDQLNEILVRTIELDELLNKTGQLIENTLKALYVDFLLVNYSTEKAPRIIGSSKKTYSPQDINEMKRLFDGVHSKLIVTDELVDLGHTKLSEYMNEINSAAAVRLVTHKQQIGFLILGIKQSGDSYRNNDLNLINIISDEVSLAVQNALRFEEIENFNLTLKGKIDLATRELRKANQKLKDLDESKDDFISMASHQLRTPLTSIKGYLSMVLDGDVGKTTKSQKDMLSQAYFSSQRMVYLISDLLNVSRLRTGKFVIEPAPVNLADLIEQEMSQLKETAGSRSLELIYVKPKEFPILMLDETKTRQVIMNFADNAIYYTPSGGKIEVKLINNAETVEMRVVDNGIGVAKSDQHHLFTKFYRAGNARQARPDGTGLGLFMAKKVILAEGGSLIFESEEGKGSTFGFTFSKSKLAPPKGKIQVKAVEEAPITSTDKTATESKS